MVLVGGIILLTDTTSAATGDSLDLVILVDESSSLGPSDVEAEIQAVASLVARREISGDALPTRVAIAGFGSGMAAVDEKCLPTVVTTKNVQDFIRCANKVSRRSSAGQHTDFAKAFDYASSVFRNLKSKSSARVVILLTDGKYDPTGKRKSSGLTAKDKKTLNVATAALRGEGVQIWPLGFGKVSEDELNELARKGAPSRCPTGRPPYAIIATNLSLGDYLLEILGATICADIKPPKIVPYDYEVHPFVNEVTLTIRGASDEPNVLVVATNKALCIGEWKRAEDGSLACNVKVTGPETGTWKITSAADVGLQEKPTVETSQSGRVDLQLSQCEDSSAVVSVSRIDNTEIRWDPSSGSTFPRAVVVDKANRKEIGSIVLTSDSGPVSLLNSGAILNEIEVSLASSQDDFVWLTASIDACEVKPSVSPTTLVSSAVSPTTLVSPAVSPTTLVSPTTAKDDDEGNFLWLLLFLFVVLLGIGWYLLRRSKKGKFPLGAELRQRNVVQNPEATWNTRADLGGQRAVNFSLDRNGWLVESSKEDAVLTVQRVRSQTEGDFVVIQPARASDGGEAEEGTKAYYGFSVQGESGPGISVKNTYIRVEVPEDVEEDVEEDE